MDTPNAPNPANPNAQDQFVDAVQGPAVQNQVQGPQYRIRLRILQFKTQLWVLQIKIRLKSLQVKFPLKVLQLKFQFKVPLKLVQIYPFTHHHNWLHGNWLPQVL